MNQIRIVFVINIHYLCFHKKTIKSLFTFKKLLSMRKITLLLSFIVCVMFAQAQTNLLKNPSFEEWSGGKPTEWLVPANSAHASAITVSEETTLVSNGSKAFKVVTDATQNPGYQQTIPVTPGKTYTIKIDYYIVSGDGTDARIWSNFKNGSTYFSDTELGTTLLGQLKGPGGTSSYFPDVKGSWQTYTVDVVAPANATDFAFEFRTYKTTTVIWDNMFFGEKGTGTGTSNPSEDALQAFVSGKNLMIKNAVEGSKVEIYSALGSKVQTSTLEDGKVSLDNLSKGLYVVRIGKKAQKFML